MTQKVDILCQIKQIERQLLEVKEQAREVKETRQLALGRYVENLKHMQHNELQP